MPDELTEHWSSNWSDDDWNNIAKRLLKEFRHRLNLFLKNRLRIVNAEDREEILFSVFNLLIYLIRYGEPSRSECPNVFEGFRPMHHVQATMLENPLRNAVTELHSDHKLINESSASINRILEKLAREIASSQKLRREAAYRDKLVAPEILDTIPDPHEYGIDSESPVRQRLEEKVRECLAAGLRDSSTREASRTALSIARRLENLTPEAILADETLVNDFRLYAKRMQKARPTIIGDFFGMMPALGAGGFGATYIAPAKSPGALKTSPQIFGGNEPRDHVSFTVTSAKGFKPGSSIEIDVWAHLTDQRAEVVERAREQHGSTALSLKTKGPAPLERDTVLTVELRILGAEVYPQEDTIHWLGEVTNASFIVSIPTDFPETSLRAEVVIRCRGLIIVRLPFLLAVDKWPDSKGGVLSTGSPFHSAFASYASIDRDEVLARIQGMQKALRELDVFVDVASLRSGDLWQEKLREEILKRDVLYLFWSEAASKSKWVDWEWRCAFDAKGEKSIDPVPLVSPTIVKPPPELAALHFNDWILAYKRNG